MKQERKWNRKKSYRIVACCMVLCMVASMCACGSKNFEETMETTGDAEKPGEASIGTTYGTADLDGDFVDGGEATNGVDLESETKSTIKAEERVSSDAIADTMAEPMTESSKSLESYETSTWEEGYRGEEFPIEVEPTYIEPVAGTLTAGEWSDNKNWDFFQGLLQGNQDFNIYQSNWSLTPVNRISVHVVSTDQEAVVGAKVSFYDQQNQLIYQSVTDHNGNAYVFYGLFAKQQDGIGKIEVSTSKTSETVDVTSEMSSVDITLSTYDKPSKKLDVMFLCDTTGSMGDELIFLQKEVENVIETVKQNNANLPTRISVGFYRDHGDEYVVSNYPFETNLDTVMNTLRQQNASGGGDYEEALEEALYDAVHHLQWSDDSTKICFIILDAPPHQTSEVCETIQKVIVEAASKGIRMIPIAGSGVDKNTEFLLRTLALTTGGTYTFLTNDSGVGGSHIEPTVGDYQIEKLNNMMVRLINEYLAY